MASSSKFSFLAVIGLALGFLVLTAILIVTVIAFLQSSQPFSATITPPPEPTLTPPPISSSSIKSTLSTWWSSPMTSPVPTSTMTLSTFFSSLPTVSPTAALPTSSMPTSPTTSEALSPTPTQPPLPPGWHAASQLFLASINRSADPCNDFYSYACGQWIATYDEDTSWPKLAQDQLVQDVFSAMWQIDINDGHVDQTVKAVKVLLDGCLSTTNTTFAGAKQIHDSLAQFGGWPMLDVNWSFESKVPSIFQDLAYTVGWLYARYDVKTLLVPQVIINSYEKTPNELFLTGAQLTIDSCDPYVETGCWEYVRQVMTDAASTMSQLWNITIDDQDIRKDIEDMVVLEQKLLNASWTDEVKKPAKPIQVNITYTNDTWPSISWKKYFDAVFVDLFSLENLSSEVQTNGFWLKNADYIDALNSTVVAEYVQDTKGRRTMMNYLLWRIVYQYMPFAGEPLNRVWDRHVARMRLVTKRPRGKPGIFGDYFASSPHFLNFDFGPMSNESCLSFLDMAAPFATGRIYVDYKFSANASNVRQHVSSMLRNITNVYKSTLDGLPWMDTQTKTAAKRKIDFLVVNMMNADFAFDDQKLDAYYAYLTPVLQNTSIDFYDVQLALQERLTYSTLDQLGHTGVDRSSWGVDVGLGPLKVNAWYMPVLNSITVPAGIMTLPYYRFDFPTAVNYGALGFILAHEQTHAFNRWAQGFDEQGDAKPWMSDQSKIGFDNMTECVANQYSKFCYEIKMGDDVDTFCVDPDRTEDENLADGGGAKNAYRAYVTLAGHRPQEPPLPGLEDLTMEQVFFLSYAQPWCERLSQDALVMQLTSSHSPGRDRVIGALQNLEEFSKAWDCKDGDFMISKQQCVVW